MNAGKGNPQVRNIGRFLFIVILIISFFPPYSWQSTTQAASLVVQPDLSPELDGDFCVDAWYQIATGFTHPIYLTLNAVGSENSSNSAIWKPNIPATGNYLVEAYIPDHAPIEWDCNTDHTANSDTTQAHYTVNHADGKKTVIVNQAAANGWTSLGTFRFTAGQVGSIELTDLNTELPEFSTTVLFSAIRFTPVSSGNYLTYLPLVSKAPIVVPTFSWTATNTGTVAEAFSPNQAMRLYVRGTTTGSGIVPTNFVWSITGPCSTYTVPSEVVNISSSTWTIFKDWTVPNCPGIYTYTVEAQSGGTSRSVSGLFVINNPSTVAPFDKPFFDKCTVASVNEMQTWWNASPYHGTNLYIGGVSRACSNTLLTASWVSQIAAQGWSFIPTWVGYQAPCSTYKNRIPWNINDAYQLGRTEADKAVAAAHSLGFLGNHVIYHDMEVYPNTDVSCRNVVNSFFAGWTNRLHDWGFVAGAYGAASNADYWYTGLDEVWIAKWYTSDKYYYDPYASVYNLLPYLSNEEWLGHRLRQYTGGHNEAWGNVVFAIDSNAAHGFANFIPQGITSGESVENLSDHIVDFKSINNDEGFVIKSNQLLWTTDAGNSWQNLTPPSASEKSLMKGFFFDSAHGYVAATDPKDASLSILETLDGGNSWNEVKLPALIGYPGSVTSLGFTDPQNGWLSVKLATGSNFSLGVLYRTADGGKSWFQYDLPVGGEVVFSTPETGWLAGGPDDSELYKTSNGGSTWEQLQFFVEDALVTLPAFTNSSHGTIAVTINDPEKTRVELYSTNDGGINWNLSAIQPLDPLTAPSTPIELSIDGSGNPVLSLPVPENGSQEKVNGFSFIGGSGLPDGIVEMNFSGSTGWVSTVNGTCTGEKGLPEFNCSLGSGLFQTTDGGISWEEITP